MWTLVLESVHCVEAHDAEGKDECILQIWACHLTEICMIMTDGDAHSLCDMTFPFHQSARIDLWEQDNTSDGLLGSKEIGSHPIEHDTIHFGLDDALYVLTYSVRPRRL
jgi:hypothetical protein